MPVERAAQNAGAAPAEDDCCEPPVTRVGRANRSQGCIGGHATTVVSDMELQPPSVGALRGGQPTLGPFWTPAGQTTPAPRGGFGTRRAGRKDTGAAYAPVSGRSRARLRPRLSAGTFAPFAADCPGARLLGAFAALLEGRPGRWQFPRSCGAFRRRFVSRFVCKRQKVRLTGTWSK